MDQDATTRIVTILAVVIIVATVVVVVSNDDEVESGTVETAAIYGNVNGDYYIDETDIMVIEDIINGDRSLRTTPSPTRTATATWTISPSWKSQRTARAQR